jgi:hypothetical protein
MHNEELNSLQGYFVAEKQQKWTGHIARIWQVINEHKLLTRQLKPLVRQIRKAEDNINMDLTTMKCNNEDCTRIPSSGWLVSTQPSTSARSRLLGCKRTYLLSTCFIPALWPNHSHIP